MHKLGLVALLFIVFLGLTVRGQSNGGISGVVTDPGKGRIVKARIYIQKKGFRQTLVSDIDGKYEVKLPIGVYKIRVEQDGFVPSKTRRIQIKDEAKVEVDFVLIGIRNDTNHP